MTTQYQPGFRPDIEVIVNDYTLSLTEVEGFSTRYGPSTGGEVRIVSRWGGPAAGGPGWGGPEIAVAIIFGEMLRRASSDAYNLVRAFIVETYRKIKTRSGARLYVDGAMAVGVDSEAKALRILFCFPESLTPQEVEERLRLVEQHWKEVLLQFEGRAPEKNYGGANMEVKVCWHDDQSVWAECQPMPTGV
jgi:hypothetical protein